MLCDILMASSIYNINKKTSNDVRVDVQASNSARNKRASKYVEQVSAFQLTPSGASLL